MDDFLWAGAAKVINLAITATVVITVCLIVVEAAYLLLLAIALARTKRTTDRQ